MEYVRCLFNGEEWEDCCDCPNPWGGGNGQNLNCTYRPGSEDITLELETIVEAGSISWESIFDHNLH